MKKTLHRDEWPDVIDDTGLNFRSVDHGLKYVEERMETLRLALIERNWEKVKLEDSLFWYRLGFWFFVVSCIGLLICIAAQRAWSFLEGVLS